MKRLVLLAVLCLAMNACNITEEKVARIIKEEMNLTLDDIQSYDPVSLDIENRISTPLEDPYIMQLGRVYMMAVNDTTAMKDKFNEARLSFAHARQANTRLKYQKAIVSSRERYHAAIKEVAELKDSIPALARVLIPESVHIARHIYRCKNTKGEFKLHDETFVIDDKCSRIIYREDNKDTSILAIKEAINSLLEGIETNNK